MTIFRNSIFLCFAHKFLSVDPILVEPAPIEIPRREILIGTGFTKIGTMLTKLFIAIYHDRFCDIRLVHYKEVLANESQYWFVWVYIVDRRSLDLLPSKSSSRPNTNFTKAEAPLSSQRMPFFFYMNGIRGGNINF